MTDVHSAESAASDEYFRSLRQGSLLRRASENAEAFSILGEECDVVAVVSQTCDVVLPKRPTVVIAPIIELQDDELQRALRRDDPRFVHLPLHGEASFADLANVHAVEKSHLAGSASGAGIDLDDDDAVRTLALSIGRWFSRFPLPDDVVPWIRPLLGVIRHKYNKTQSPLGQVLQHVVEIRVEARLWSERPLDLILHVIVRAGSVPAVDDSALGQVPDGATDADGNVLSPSALAELIVREASPSPRAALWPLMADSLASICRPSTKDSAQTGVLAAVAGVAGEFWADDEFPLSKYRKSELLDVDYLSAGYPL